MEQTYRSQTLDHLGLVAGMFDELGIGDVIDKATQQNPEMRSLTVGEAVKAMVLNGLGCINQTLYLVPRFFQNKPTSRLIAPRVVPAQLNDDALGRALDTLYDYGVTELYSLIAATAAKRLGLAPTFVHLDSTSFHVDGRYNSEEEPEAQVIHITRGYSRDHRPDLYQVILEVIVEHQAGIPGLMHPLSGNSSDVKEFGPIIKEHIARLQTTYGTTYLVADSALYSEDNLHKLAATKVKWITRVPATLSDAQAVLAQAMAHPYSLALAQHFAAFLHHRRREASAVQTYAETLLTLATAHGFPLYVGYGTCYQGWALAAQGQGEAGLAEIRRGLSRLMATGLELSRPLWFVLLAEVAGQVDPGGEGGRLLAEALAAFETSERGDMRAEAYRLQGEWLLRQAEGSARQSARRTEAETWFRQALTLARHQQAKSWELRAALSLSRLWQQCGKRQQARQLLVEVYAWFSEGFDTADLQETQRLLEALT